MFGIDLTIPANDLSFDFVVGNKFLTKLLLSPIYPSYITNTKPVFGSFGVNVDTNGNIYFIESS